MEKWTHSTGLHRKLRIEDIWDDTKSVSQTSSLAFEMHLKGRLNTFWSKLLYHVEILDRRSELMKQYSRNKMPPYLWHDSVIQLYSYNYFFIIQQLVRHSKLQHNTRFSMRKYRMVNFTWIKLPASLSQAWFFWHLNSFTTVKVPQSLINSLCSLTQTHVKKSLSGTLSFHAVGAKKPRRWAHFSVSWGLGLLPVVRVYFSYSIKRISKPLLSSPFSRFTGLTSGPLFELLSTRQGSQILYKLYRPIHSLREQRNWDLAGPNTGCITSRTMTVPTFTTEATKILKGAVSCYL